MSRSQRVVQQLGMSHGAAAGKLRKNILFHLLVRLQENICFKCRQRIFSVNDLSIEHKQPWEGRDANLFWDLNNVAFSHIVCNRPHNYSGNRKVAPEGMAWCSGHKSFESVDLFDKSASRWNGCHSYCKASKSGMDSRKNHAKIGELTESGNVPVC